jgi:hypothetical protein
MPYFDMESTEAYDSSKTEAGRDNYALERAYPKPSELHVTQTLNRSYHLSLQDTKRRDNDQVVLSYTTQRRNNWKALQAEGKQKKPEDYQAQDNDQDETKISIPSYDIDFTQHQENPFHTQQPGVQDVSQDDISPVDIQVPAAIRINTVNRRNSQHELGGGITPTEQPSQKQVAADKGPGVAMLMVHQLWLWKIDERKV